MNSRILKITKLVAIAAIFSTAFTSCVKDAEPNFTFTVDGKDVTFTSTSENADVLAWDLGDNSTETSETFTHTYDAGGDYTVTLEAFNTKGEGQSTSQVVTIEEDPKDEAASHPTFGDMDGGLYAVNTSAFTSQGGFNIETKVSTAVAFFFDGPTTRVGAGAVSIEGNALDNKSDTYIYTDISGTNTSGWTGNVSWDVAGAGSIPAVTTTTTKGFPTTYKVNSSATVNSSSTYTLSVETTINDADSILYLISGPDGIATKTTANRTSSVTFSASELSAIGTGTGIAQVVPYTLESTTVGGKKFYLVNESVANLNVTIN